MVLLIVCYEIICINLVLFKHIIGSFLSTHNNRIFILSGF